MSRTVIVGFRLALDIIQCHLSLDNVKGLLNLTYTTARVVVPNYVLHITQRGNYRQNILTKEEYQDTYGKDFFVHAS